MKQDIQCNFSSNYYFYDIYLYCCHVKNHLITENVEIEFVGNHLDGKTNLNVELVVFEECTVTKIPIGLTKCFPNLKFLSIQKSKLKEIDREDLTEYGAIKYLDFHSNLIEYLPGDLFTDMKHLEFIDFSNNKIQIIEPNVLDGLNNLRCVKFQNNPCINTIYDLKTNLGYNFQSCQYYYENGFKSLDQIKQEIRDKFSTPTQSALFDKIKIMKQIFKNEIWYLKAKCETGICGDIMRIIQNEELKDFTVKINDEEFRVHKLLLAARSSVFAEMIQNNIDAEELNLIDISVDIFREILNFIYTDVLPISNDINFEHLFLAAGRLKIEKLKDFAAEKLVEKVNAENAFEMLILSNKYDQEKLRKKSFAEIKKIFGDECIDEDLAQQTDTLKEALEYKRIKDENDAKMKNLLKKK